MQAQVPSSGYQWIPVQEQVDTSGYQSKNKWIPVDTSARTSTSGRKEYGPLIVVKTRHAVQNALKAFFNAFYYSRRSL